MRILLNAYPHEAWKAHPSFKQATRNWPDAHQIFRQLSEAVRKDVEGYLDGLKGSQVNTMQLTTETENGDLSSQPLF